MRGTVNYLHIRSHVKTQGRRNNKSWEFCDVISEVLNIPSSTSKGKGWRHILKSMLIVLLESDCEIIIRNKFDDDYGNHFCGFLFITYRWYTLHYCGSEGTVTMKWQRGKIFADRRKVHTDCYLGDMNSIYSSFRALLFVT